MRLATCTVVTVLESWLGPSVNSACLYILFLPLTYLPSGVLQGSNEIRKLHKYSTKF